MLLTALEWFFSNEDVTRDLYVKFLTRYQHQGERTCTYMLSCEVKKKKKEREQYDKVK